MGLIGNGDMELLRVIARSTEVQPQYNKVSVLLATEVHRGQLHNAISSNSLQQMRNI